MIIAFISKLVAIAILSTSIVSVPVQNQHFTIQEPCLSILCERMEEYRIPRHVYAWHWNNTHHTGFTVQCLVFVWNDRSGSWSPVVPLSCPLSLSCRAPGLSSQPVSYIFPGFQNGFVSFLAKYLQGTIKAMILSLLMTWISKLPTVH